MFENTKIYHRENKISAKITLGLLFDDILVIVAAITNHQITPNDWLHYRKKVHSVDSMK